MPTVILPSAFVKFTGKSQCVVEGSSVAEVLQNLLRTYPILQDYCFDKQHNLSDFLSVFINDVDIRQKNFLNTATAVNDILTILTPIAGG